MEHILFYPFADYWWLYLGFTAFVFALLAPDLGVFHREAHEVGFKEALGGSIAWISLALLAASTARSLLLTPKPPARTA